jgi:nucleotide-binding universal stress UspA family protein
MRETMSDVTATRPQPLLTNRGKAAHAHTIIVGVTNSQASIDALTAALALARQRKSKVYVVHVLEVLRSLPLTSELDVEARKGEQVLRKAEQAASTVGYAIEGELLQAREAGQALVDEAREREADLVVVGIGRRRVLGDASLGRTATFVLKHADCDVWIIQQGTVRPHEHLERE